MKKMIFCTSIFVFINIGLVIAQSIHDTLIENKVFKEVDSKWFVADKKNPEKFYMLDQNVITIKFTKQAFIEGDKMMKIDFDAKSIRKAQTGYVDYELPQGIDFFEFLKKLKTQKDIEDVVINTIGEYNTFTPDDPHFNDQWYLNKILMPEVWDFVEGNSCIVVAIIDSGTDWLHEDIGNGNDSYNNLYHNIQEDIWTTATDPTTGNGIDDDGNGFIDDWIGWDFENQDNDARAASNSHGTQVAGITSAKTHNTVGVAGVGGGLNNQGILLMPIKIGESAPIGNLVDDAILYAIDNGADVIQMSLGVNQSNAIDSAIQVAENANIAVVCASGNNYRATINYPASNQNVFSVGATDQNDYRCDFSNYGSNLFMAAPGKDIYSTTLSNGYGDGDGTSFAAPQVSGVIALLKRISPNISNDEVRTVLMNTADKVGGYTYSSGRCNELGYGRLNAYAAIQSVYPTISGPYNVCMNGTSFTIGNLPPVDSIIWEHGPYLTISSGQNNDTCTISAVGNGNSWVRARLFTGCGEDITLPDKDVATVWPSGTWVQNGQSHPLNTVNFITYGSWIQATVSCPGLTGSNWVLTHSSGVSWNQGFYNGMSYVNLYPSTPQSYADFRLDLNTADCGTISPTYHFVPGYGYAFTMSPNPAEDEVVVKRLDKNQVDERNTLKPKLEKYKQKEFKTWDTPQEKFTVKLYSERLGLLKTVHTEDESCRIDLRNLPAGTYFLHIENDYVLYQEQLIIRK